MFSWYVCLFASIRVSWVSGGAPKFEKHPCWWKTPLSPKNRKTSWCYAMPGAFGYCIPLPCSPKMPVSDICTNTQTCIHIYIYIYIYIYEQDSARTHTFYHHQQKLVECGRDQTIIVHQQWNVLTLMITCKVYPPKIYFPKQSQNGVWNTIFSANMTSFQVLSFFFGGGRYAYNITIS